MNPVNIFVANSLNAVEGQLTSGEPLEKGRKMLLETSLNNFRHCTSSLECIPIKAGFIIGTVYPYHPSLQGMFPGNIKEDFCKMIFLKEIICVAAPRTRRCCF